ncbi:RidA family protein [Paenarthrobacter sp. NPDC089316]|uniref:RidA family protein n=1 Tax=unclassified Paenarthrobacter TaxID=2634190 RepID=UPI003434D0B2
MTTSTIRPLPINPETLAPPAGHFDRAIRIGNWLSISGTSALTNLTGEIEDRILPESFRDQANATFDNIEAVLASVGGTLADIYDFRVTLADGADFGELNDIFRERLPERGFTGHGFVAGFLAPGMKIEIAASAYLHS